MWFNIWQFTLQTNGSVIFPSLRCKPESEETHFNISTHYFILFSHSKVDNSCFFKVFVFSFTISIFPIFWTKNVYLFMCPKFISSSIIKKMIREKVWGTKKIAVCFCLHFLNPNRSQHHNGIVNLTSLRLSFVVVINLFSFFLFLGTRTSLLFLKI